MKIAFFTNCYKPLINGVVSSIVSLKEAYERKGHQTYIFAPKVEGYQDQEENVFRYHSINLTSKVKYPIAIPLSLRATKVIHEFKPDIVHIHHPFVLSLPAIMYGARLKIPKVLTIHTQYERYAYYISPIPQVITNEAIRRMIINLAAKVDVITTPSLSMKNLISQYGVKKEVKVVPNAVNLDYFQNRDDQQCRRLMQQLDLKEDDIVMLYVGRISFEKNVDKIIKALAIIKAENVDNVKLVMVGEGTAMNQIRSLVNSLELSKMTRFVGAVNNDMVRYYYQISDIFTFASTSETFGIVIIEAFASSLPILAIKAPGVIDIVTDGVDGLLSEDDVTQFAERLKVLIKNKDLRNKLASGALNTAKHYSIDHISDQMIHIYQDLIKNSKSNV
ncbi:MAG: glycosyltransferase [Candidatus Atribacteria bacterium]|nr:glycosyltransferase [Candidatus Atribacteria bacterium]